MARVSEETKQLTRERLLQAAADEFAREGLAGANINRISVDAGFAKGTVYNYFESKEALFLAVIEDCTLALGELALPDQGSARERVKALLTLDVEWARENESFAKILVRETLSANEELYPKILAATAPLISLVVAALEHGVETGEVRDDVPTPQLALALVGLHEMALVQHWGSGGWPTYEEIPELVTRLFFEGAVKREGETC
jgi:AcrR family transcriptional regulator